MMLRKETNKSKFCEAVDCMVGDQIVIGLYDESKTQRLSANAKVMLLKAIDMIEIEE